MYGMLIYKIVRHIMDLDAICSLSCTFPPGNRLISVTLDFSWNKSTEVQQFKLDPEAPIKVSMVITQTVISTEVFVLHTQNEK